MEPETLEWFKNLFEKLLGKPELQLIPVKERSPEAGRGDEVDIAHSEQTHLMQRRLLGRNKRYRTKVKEALSRIKEGTFGQCEECGQDITLQRLRARPVTTLCINCKEEEERIAAQRMVPTKVRKAPVQKAVLFRDSVKTRSARMLIEEAVGI